MEHPIKDERPDLDEVWPLVPDREVAKFLLSRIVDDPRTAQNVWNAVVRPLYDLREVSSRWPRGRCSCGAVHPGMRHMYPGLRSEASRGHRMWCLWYVGPIHHAARRESTGFASGEPMIDCACGERYYKWADDDWTRRNVCPDFLFIWKGEEVTMSTEKDEKRPGEGGDEKLPDGGPPPGGNR